MAILFLSVHSFEPDGRYVGGAILSVSVPLFLLSCLVVSIMDISRWRLIKLAFMRVSMITIAFFC